MRKRVLPLAPDSLSASALAALPLRDLPAAFLTAIMVLGGVALLAVPVKATADIPIAEAFDWSMPPRLLEDTALSALDPAFPVPKFDPDAWMLPPGGWRVDFDACAVTPGPVAAYEWSVDGVVVGTVTDCEFSHHFPVLGTWQVALKLSDGSGASTTLEQMVTVQDWLIIAVGDSYGSGEGNPEKPVTPADNIDLSFAQTLIADTQSELLQALDELPGREEAEQAARQLRDDALVTRDQLAADLAALQAELAALVVIQTNVENHPPVVEARAYRDHVQVQVNLAQAQVNSAQSALNSALAAYASAGCGSFPPNPACPGLAADVTAAQANLTAAQAELLVWQTELELAEAALLLARNAAVLIYSAIATVQNFSALNAALAAAQAAVNTKQNALNAAQNVYQNALAAWQQTLDALNGLLDIIDVLQAAWHQAREEFLSLYLDRLPVWTSVPPSWGTAEPGYAEIVLGGEGVLPGEALRCHRSMVSGQARAALLLEQADPRTSVTLVHLACSGATIEEGLIGEYGGQPIDSLLDPLVSGATPLFPGLLGREDLANMPPMAPQLIAAVEAIQGREVDALLVSIGGNDIRFSTMIEQCMLGEPCHTDLGAPPPAGFDTALQEAIEANCRPAAVVNLLTGASLAPGTRFPFTDVCLQAYDLTAQNIATGAAEQTFIEYMFGVQRPPPDEDTLSLSQRFNLLHNHLLEHLPELDAQRVYITQYPDLTGNDDGDYCGWDPAQALTSGLPGTLPEGLKNVPGVTRPEMEWAGQTVARTLSDVTEWVAASFQWQFISETGVDGQTIASVTRNHGYCADNRWVVTLPEALLQQQDIFGTLHPNAAGHAVYAQAIYHQLLADLYPGGLEQPPRPPLHVPPPVDSSGDGVPDFMDNCIGFFNPDQRDTNGNGIGNRCDADLNGDGIVNFADLALFRARFGSTDPDADFNGDGVVNFADLAIFQELFGKPPGPSAFAP